MVFFQMYYCMTLSPKSSTRYLMVHLPRGSLFWHYMKWIKAIILQVNFITAGAHSEWNSVAL